MLKRLRFSLFALSLIFSQTLFAQTANEFNQRIRTAVNSRDYAAAIIELKNFEQQDKRVFALNNYDYLLARTAEKQGDFALAAASYEVVVKRNSILREYALWHLAQIARASGNLLLEKVYLRQLLTVVPNGLTAKAASARLLRSNFESENFDVVVGGTFQAAASNATSSQSSVQESKTASQTSATPDRETQVYIGQSYQRLGKINEARNVFNAIIKNTPNSTQPDDFALAGVRGLDEIEVGKENFGKIAPQLSDAEHYRRAFVYQFNRDFPLARLHYQAMVDNFPQSPFTPDAMYQIGRGFAQEENFEEAVKWFERVQTEYALQPIARDALSQAASGYSRLNKPKEAVNRYKLFIEKYADAPNLERAYLNIVDIKRDTGANSEALEWAAKTREVFKGKLPEAIALFAQARIHISQNDWTNALADLNELQNLSDLGGTRVPGGTNKAEVDFLRGFSLENLGRYNEATEVYLSIPDGRNEYYGWRATERLRAMAADEKSAQFLKAKFGELNSVAAQATTNESAENIRQAAQSAIRLTTDEIAKNQLIEIIRKAYALLPAYQKIPNGALLDFGRKEILTEAKPVQMAYHQTLADELLFLDLYDEAAPEFEASLGESSGVQPTASSKSQISNPKLAYTLAVFYNRGDWANRAVAYAEPLWRNVPADYQIELIPREQILLLYPAPYADSLLKYSAAPRSLDPRFTLSIMRQESRFRADVKSYAAARGLMQFISTTSDKLADELAVTNFRQDDLYNPPTAIVFGSQYLANLFRQFPNQPPAVAAAYNGGESNVARWLARAKSAELDRYVPEILFTQSKDYVYRVMANYRVYQIFYDERLTEK